MVRIQTPSKNVIAVLVASIAVLVTAQAHAEVTLVRGINHNDLLGGGWTRNADDLRSFGIGAVLEIDHTWWFEWEISGLTNRSTFAPSAAGRIDEMRVFGAYQHTHKINDTTVLFLKPRLGVLAWGDFGGQGMQNLVHRTLGIPEVFIDYDEESGATALVGGRAEPRLLVSGTKENGWWGVGILDIEWAHSYNTRVSTGVGTGVYGRAGDFIRLDTVYRFIDHASDSSTARRVANYEDGLVIQFEQVLGLLSYRYEINAFTGFSVGYLGIDFWRPPKVEHDFEEADVESDFGFNLLDPSEYLRFTFRPFGDDDIRDHLYLALENRWGNLLGLPGNDDLRGNFIQVDWLFGATLFRPEPKFQISPWAGFGPGFRREVLFVTGSSLPTSQASTVEGVVEAGIKITLPIPALSKHTLYGINIGWRYSLSATETKAFEDEWGIDEPYLLNESQHSLGIAISSIVDL